MTKVGKKKKKGINKAPSSQAGGSECSFQCEELSTVALGWLGCGEKNWVRSCREQLSFALVVTKPGQSPDVGSIGMGGSPGAALSDEGQTPASHGC